MILSLLLISLTICLLIFSADRLLLAMRHRREHIYLPAMKDAAAEFQIPVSMILAIARTESDFRPTAKSTAGAIGLMQLMPDTFLYLTEDKLKEGLPEDLLTDPATNIRYGTYYLSLLYEEFDDWVAALAAYNAGEGRVRLWLKDPSISPNGKLSHIPFPETEQYVKNVLAAYTTYCRKY